MINQEKDIIIQQNDNYDFHSLKTDLYSIYSLCNQNLLNEESTIDINQIKIDDIIFHIKSSLNNIISFQTQLKNYIIKLESDIRHFLKREFQFNIIKNSLEYKLQAYTNIVEEYQELKEKVHFSRGKFLENDRKDNEIMILKKENSSIKKEIVKYQKKYESLEEQIEKDQDIIDELKIKNNKLNNLVSELKKQCFQNMRNNSSINLNIINNNNINQNPNKNKKNGMKKNTFFNTPKSPYNLDSFYSNFTTTNKSKFEYKRKIKSEFTMGNDRSNSTKYNKIFYKNKKNIYGVKKYKTRSISMLLDDNDKKENYNWMNNTTNKHISYKMKNLTKYKLSLQNKNELFSNLRNYKDHLSKRIFKNNINIKGKNSICIKRIFQKNDMI